MPFLFSRLGFQSDECGKTALLFLWLCDEYGFVLVKADSSDYQSIIEPDSLYMRVLKLYFDANQMGLVDPESSTQSYESFENKYKEGQILFCTWPWVAQPAYNTEARVKGRKGLP